MDQASAAVPIPSSPTARSQMDGVQAGAVTDTLVVKNIPFHLPDSDFIAILNSFDAKPKHVRYIYDKVGGAFKGMAFVKYPREANINAMMAALQGLDVMGRKLRIELKRGGQTQQQQQPSQVYGSSYEESPERIQPQQRGNGRPRRATIERRGREEELAMDVPQGSYGSPTLSSSWEPSRKRTARSISKGSNSYIPKGPDGTKGFSSEYQAQRTTFPRVPSTVNGESEHLRDAEVADEPSITQE